MSKFLEVLSDIRCGSSDSQEDIDFVNDTTISNYHEWECTLPVDKDRKIVYIRINYGQSCSTSSEIKCFSFDLAAYLTDEEVNIVDELIMGYRNTDLPISNLNKKLNEVYSFLEDKNLFYAHWV